MRYIILIILFYSLVSCQTKYANLPKLLHADIGKVTEKMTDVMVQDITNPPLAARFFAYATLSGYEVIALNDTTYKSMHGLLNDFPEIQKPTNIAHFSVELSAVLAILKTAQKMQPSGAALLTFQKSYLDSCKSAGFSQEIIDGSLLYAENISSQVLKYAKADKYNLISNYPRYEPSGKLGSWYPTPPGYFAPVEPHFAKIRTFLMDSAAQFKPIPPVAFSESKSSAFYKLLQLNYQDTLDDHKRNIAAFWDCNPFALDTRGHLNVGMKKISPGAHWIGITDIACRKAEVDFKRALQITTVVSVGMMDAFIACWDEKYRSDRIRPETAIRKLIDPQWTPLLQTPPFPEYLSGHSVVSAAEAVILTYFFGDNFAYDDTVEERFNLKARHYNSFNEASQEAAISRFYGGIHYMDAIEVGVEQGKEVGNWVVAKMKTRGIH